MGYCTLGHCHTFSIIIIFIIIPCVKTISAVSFLIYREEVISLHLSLSRVILYIFLSAQRDVESQPDVRVKTTDVIHNIFSHSGKAFFISGEFKRLQLFPQKIAHTLHLVVEITIQDAPERCNYFKATHVAFQWENILLMYTNHNFSMSKILLSLFN